MRNLFKNPLFYLSVVLVVAIGFIAFSFVRATSSFHEPTEDFPRGEVAAPIDESDTSQTKEGSLTLNGPLRVGNGLCLPNTSSDSLNNAECKYSWDTIEPFVGAVTTEDVKNWNDESNARPGSGGSGHTLLMGDAENGPGPARLFYSFSFAYGDSGNVTQFAIPYYTNYSDEYESGIFMRSRYQDDQDEWKPWKLVSPRYRIGETGYQKVDRRWDEGGADMVNLNQFVKNPRSQCQVFLKGFEGAGNKKCRIDSYGGLDGVSSVDDEKINCGYICLGERDANPPSTPGNLSVSVSHASTEGGKSTYEAEVNWDSVEGAKWYVLSRRREHDNEWFTFDSGNYLNYFNASATSYFDSLYLWANQSSVTYFYKIEACNSAGCSASSTVSVTLP